MNHVEIADRIATELEESIRTLPDNFYSSFDYTTTGNNFTHPITWGLLAEIVRSIPTVVRVAIDPRFNANREKFQPDIVGINGDRFKDDSIVVYVDYESPNSSDARIPTKDIEAFIKWRHLTGIHKPYIVITTLPKTVSLTWELRWTGKDQYNRPFNGQEDQLRENPFSFWYRYYEEEFAKCDMSHIALINIDGKKVTREYPKGGKVTND